MRYLRQGSLVRSRQKPCDERREPTLYAEYHQADDRLSGQEAEVERLRELFANAQQEGLARLDIRNSEPATQPWDAGFLLFYRLLSEQRASPCFQTGANSNDGCEQKNGCDYEADKEYGDAEPTQNDTDLGWVKE